MAERRTARSERREPELAPLPPSSKLTQYRTDLAIDPENINNEVCGHPEAFEHVGNELALASARLDRAKYDLELAEATEARDIREDALKEDRKLTEGGLRELVALSKEVQARQLALIDAKAQVGQWAAVKESWQQRSYMLKECVAIYLARMNSSPTMTAPRDALAEGVRERAGQLRQERGFRRGRPSE